MNLAPAQHFIYACRKDDQLAYLDKIQHALAGHLLTLLPNTPRTNLKQFIASVRHSEVALKHISDKQLALTAKQNGLRLRRSLSGLRATEAQSRDGLKLSAELALVADIFACVVEASQRVLSMRHFDCQLQAGLALYKGRIAEMATGEGKTLTATLTAACAGLAGIPVHVISVNDYLTARDASEMRDLYLLLGLSVGCVNSAVQHEDRRNEYSKNITYCTAKDVTFDYLRDRLRLKTSTDNTWLQSEYLFNPRPESRNLTLRGLHFAIVDEADSILIDEAKTPLIISANKGGEQEEQFLRQASAVASSLVENEDYLVNHAASFVKLNDKAKAMLDEKTSGFGVAWRSRYRREAIVSQALAANFFFHRDKHYIVNNGKIEIVDENTGRVLPDRSWERGLHQLIEIKEGCELTQQRETINKISYQRFFRRYLHLAGMTGTGMEIRQELWQTYNLKTEVIPGNKKSQRKYYPVKVYAIEEEHAQALIASIEREHAKARPVLVGTASIADSEYISQQLELKSIPHRLLNAKQDKDEAMIVAQAGQEYAVTVATQMAGRGTDIKLSEEARAAGGLHVIICQLFEANRIDRQLAGRCARQGDPGSCETLLCARHIDARNKPLRVLAESINTLAAFSPWLKNVLLRCVLRLNQLRIERYHQQLRQRVFKQDEKNRELLAFSGKAE